ncbi:MULTISPECIES: DNA primase [Dysgonomonas]|uniref:DNA primase n=1 Tax=Dysgonomonas TaxID=156973 RepID=UPI00092B44A0|nr:MULTISPECIES: DNA primase [Dysgonomonas]MBN9301665.1 DNA primase [Dysgonomonas mossii]OJX64380.1 MAG: DNA primase [Dysgonomonas sp. 37-18]
MSQNTAIPQHIIDQVNDIDIIDVVSEYVSLKRSGVNWIGLCPFHTDKSPSFYVSPSKQICKCFACGNPEKGGVINFVQQIEGISFPSAVRLLAKKHNIDIPEIQLSPEEEAKEKRKDSQYIALAATQKQFEDNYQASPDTQNYINNVRQISEDFRKLYGIGFAPGGNQLSKLLPSKGYKTDTLLSVGVLKQHEESGNVSDRFYNRAMFPYYDLQGRVIGFTGRDLTGQAEHGFKYINSPTTDIFNKSIAIWGLWQAKKRISETHKVHVVEGQTDVISFAQNGLQNTVAGSGTAFTDAQVKILHRFADTVVLVYDGDRAGVKASMKQIQTFLSYGMTVLCFRLPEGLDPDDLAKKLGKDSLPKKIQQGEQSFEKYMFDILDAGKKEKEERIEALDAICECIACIPDTDLQSEYIRSLANMFEMSAIDIKKRVQGLNKNKVVIEDWKPGFYGIEEASAFLAKDKSVVCELTFDHDLFMTDSHERPIVYAYGNPSTYDIQSLRTKINRFRVSADEDNIVPSYTETSELGTLKMLFKEGFDIQVEASIYNSNRDYSDDSEDEESFVSSDSYYDFCNFYIVGYGYMISGETNGLLKSDMIERCAEVISELKAAAREVMMKSYAKRLGVDKTALDKILKPILATKKDNSKFNAQRLAEMGDIATLYDSSAVPPYVLEDKVLNNIHTLYNFYPLRNSKGENVAWMYKNSTGNGYSRITDFVIEPLLHVYDKLSQANKRVVYLRHMRPELNRYVELQSSVLVNLTDLNKKIYDEGNFIFRGTNSQWQDIRSAISYDFTFCRELRILGQHTSEVFAFGNAIFHKVKDTETGRSKYEISYADKIGIVSHGNDNFYLPAFSEIRISDFDKDDSYKQAVHLKYKEIPEKDRLTFDQWASLMDEVYKINNNGKWAILYAITSAFRDFIFKERRFFTALFFIGPTSSGKSQVASSIRNLFMDVDMPLFNLNTGSFASLTMLMEQLRNIVLVLEEYNDKQIQDQVFQLLKAAVLDGVGRTKVADTATKTTTSSEINTPLVLLGQEAPQKDDGSLSNRCILRDVPYVEKGEFTEEETELFNTLKKHERIGLCNVLTDILSLRDLVEKEYLTIFDKEVKLLKDKVKQSVTNTDGLTRIINAIALLTATCKLIEQYTNLKLPFTYDTFFELGVTQVVSQLEQIATTNKLAAFFNAINTLLTRGKTVPGRDFRIKPETSVRRVVKGKDTELLDLETGMNVLYIDLNAVYSDYENFVGKDAAAPMQTLVMNFKSNPAYLGYNRAVRYNWTETGYIERGTIEATDNGGQINNRADLKILKKDRTGSAHMFNYDMLKTLFEIDLERIEHQEPPKNDDEPPMFKMTPPSEKNEDDLPF